MNVIEKEIIDSILGDLNHLINRIEHGLAAHPRLKITQGHLGSARTQLLALLRDKKSSAA